MTLRRTFNAKAHATMKNERVWVSDVEYLLSVLAARQNKTV